MSQTTSDTNTAPANGAESTTTRPAPARRRRRATPARVAQQAEAPATEAQEPTAPAAPASETPVAPAPEQAEAQTQTETGEAAPPAQGAPSRPQRSRRSAERKGTTRGKAGIQLVKPTKGEEEAQAEQPAPAETRLVPVLTETPAPPAEATAPEAPQAEARPAPPAEPAPRRYRFERRQPAISTAPVVRPERLSGRLTQPGETAPEAATAEPEKSAAVEETAVTETAPLAGEPSAEAAQLQHEMRDIAAELGLISPGPEPLQLPVRHEEPQAEEHPEAHEAEEQAAEEGAAEGTEEQPSVSRRRRRRRRSTTHGAASEETAAEGEGEEQAEEPAWAEETGLPPEEPAPYATAMEPYEPETYSRNGREVTGYGSGYTSQPYSPYGRPQRVPRREAQWDIASAQQNIGQPESPFGAPEPSFARGFGPAPRGATPARPPYTRPGRPERGTDVPPMSSNQLANMVFHSIQEQTDRLLTELRQQHQAPSMTVTFPPLPSTERIGVFVDVANLLYSARSMRVSVDFGKLLEFLRGNRRLIRAQAYAPTNPDPNAEQAFLSAVKGVGYRITTKNYKTFASGAKKADMDLDLCMDIVRLVDAGALDTVVLVSGDSDFLPLLEYCSDHGVRVEVAAFDDAAAMILRQTCDLFINLSLVPDVRG